jgi:enoyl-CoA hydratase/carnithine racemase
MSETLQSSREGRILRLRLNRPEKRNALNVELCRALTTALDRADADLSVGAVLLTAEGKAFCAGMDLDEVLSAGRDALNQVHEQLFTVGSRMTKPVVAAVHGAALAGGFGLVANCPVVLASEDATFGLTEIRLGLWPFVIFGGVAAAVGERRAVELSLTARTIDAREAWQMGLVHQVTPAAELAARAEETAAALAASSPTAVRSGLMFVQEIRGRGPEDARSIARGVRNQILASPDFAEGIRAFQEKRRPHWPSLRAVGH